MIAIRSRDRENNDTSSEKIMSLSLKAIVFYKPKSLPNFGKLMQDNEVFTFLGMRRLSRRCGWIIYTIQAVYKMTGLPADKLRPIQHGLLKPGYFADIVILFR
jgi:N-acyl-D-aspartate/D-glutamate deacylase